MINRRIILLYLLLMLVHLAHIFEEVLAGFLAIEYFGGVGNFLIINWILYACVLLIFYLILQERPTGFKFGLIYAVIMTLNGLGHNVATLITGRYFDGFAGGFTGIALIILGPILFLNILKEMKTGQSG